MKTLLFAFIGLLFLATDLADVRKMYPDASKSKATADAFYSLMADVDENHSNKVLVAYKGCAETLKSKFSSNIPDKIKFMKAGAKMIDGAVTSEPDNVEIRMIRLSVQENVPSIVNYRANRKEDHDFIIENYGKNPSTKEYVKNFILRSKSFTSAEKNSLK